MYREQIKVKEGKIKLLKNIPSHPTFATPDTCCSSGTCHSQGGFSETHRASEAFIGQKLAGSGLKSSLNTAAGASNSTQIISQCSPLTNIRRMAGPLLTNFTQIRALKSHPQPHFQVNIFFIIAVKSYLQHLSFSSARMFSFLL